MPIKVGNLTFRNNVLLAPMSGISDMAFRKMAWKFGAGMVVSEMVASEALVTGLAEMELKSAAAGLPVHMVQLSGRDCEWMARAARLVEQSGADIIDINMGCPSKRVINGYSGSALMRDLDHATAMIEAVMNAVSLPVTLKMRLGWDENSINAPELARRATETGVAMITVHGRTRNQFYKGRANWQKIARVREQTNLPLIVNGDIVSTASARKAMAESGADGVMIGRASYGAPWMAGLVARELAGSPTENTTNQSQFDALMPIDPEVPATWLAAIREHYQLMLADIPEEFAIRHARKHLGWYLDNAGRTKNGKAFSNPAARKEILTSNNPAQVLHLLETLFSTRTETPGAEKRAAA